MRFFKVDNELYQEMFSVDDIIYVEAEWQDAGYTPIPDIWRVTVYFRNGQKKDDLLMEKEQYEKFIKALEGI